MNEGREGVQRMQETATAKAENKVMTGGTCNNSENRPQDLYDCHATPKRALHGHPLGGGHPERVPQEIPHMHSTLQGRNSQIQHQILEVKPRRKSGMTSLLTTPRHPDTQQ